MITDEMKKKILDKVQKLTAEELIARFEEFGSEKISGDSDFDLHKFLDEEEKRLLGGIDAEWFFVNPFEVELKEIPDTDKDHLCNDPQDGLAA